MRTAFDGARKTQQLDGVAFETFFIAEDEASDVLRTDAPLDDDEAFDETIDESGAIDLGELVQQFVRLLEREARDRVP